MAEVNLDNMNDITWMDRCRGRNVSYSLQLLAVADDVIDLDWRDLICLPQNEVIRKRMHRDSDSYPIMTNTASFEAYFEEAGRVIPAGLKNFIELFKDGEV